ncbi:lysophospholipase [Kovacikia minuta CCNUW1]|uniref:alpha/beta hydrolase n=1 Tax=Kovacikia minuta TaxID=2931930 RepID=UPI001CCE65C7|nr:alpha/beta hydrolase [Kovacikia minuta]UBF27192.1 lysophospholipase [Kovacikia minuta CCNUW1]
MKHIEGTFKGSGGLNLYYQSWLPDSRTQAVVVMVHGLGGHSNLFDPAVQYLVPQGYEIYAFDLRGHGRSPGRRGHINRWAEFRDDLRAFLQQIQTWRPGCPCFLWGHSLGGTIALDYALRSPDGLRGVVTSAPALGKIQISPYKLALGWLLSGIYPGFSLKLGIREDFCLRLPDVCAAYLQDPLRHEYGSARLSTEFFAIVDWIHQHAADLKIPLLTLHGSSDQVTLPEASRAFFQRLTFPDAEYREYPGNYHDLLVDVEYRKVFLDLENWVERHLESSPSCQNLGLCSS